MPAHRGPLGLQASDTKRRSPMGIPAHSMAGSIGDLFRGAVERAPHGSNPCGSPLTLVPATDYEASLARWTRTGTGLQTVLRVGE